MAATCSRHATRRGHARQTDCRAVRSPRVAAVPASLTTSPALRATGVSGPAGSPGQLPGGTGPVNSWSAATGASAARVPGGMCRQRPGDAVEDVVLADQHLAEPEPLHDPVQDERAAADHVYPAGMHDADRGAGGPGLGEQAPAYLVHVSR